MLVAAVSMTMVKFSHDVDLDAKEAFDALHAEIGGKKFQLLEAMIYAFRALPHDLQLKLVSQRPQDHEPALAYLGALRWPPVVEVPQAASAARETAQRIVRLIDQISIETPEDSAAWVGLARQAGLPDREIAERMEEHARQIERARQRKRRGTG